MAKKAKKTRPAASSHAAGGGGGGADSRAGPANPTDVGYMEQIARLMAANDLNTVDVRDGDRRVILKRGQPVVSVAGFPGYAAAPLAAPSAASGGTAPASQPPAGAGASASTEESRLLPIKSPMVGTFYTAAKPGEKPFVGVGSRVVADETDVCVIEAMKNFFVQKADVSGTIVKILVENGQPVQVEQPMFLVRPD
jgi:acetyl-CoA carboxylase biotin carboxyl carrier protein